MAAAAGRGGRGSGQELPVAQDVVLEDPEVGEDDDEDDEEELALVDDAQVLLGFVEKPKNQRLLKRYYFPSKVGGTPAWLDPVHLPRGDVTTCKVCEKPLQFLLQVYAPIESVEDAFHRTLYLFCCRNGPCLLQSGSCRVFRGQLPRANTYYSFQPAPTKGQFDESKYLSQEAILCDWCGTWRADKRCSGCREFVYCSRDHQVEHWRAGHSKQCKRVDKPTGSSQEAPTTSEAVQSISAQLQGSQLSDRSADQPEAIESSGPVTSAVAEPPVLGANRRKALSGHLWMEQELVVEAESDCDTSAADAIKLVQEYQQRVRSEGSVPASEISGYVEEATGDLKHWANVQAIFAKAPDQVLRYSRSPSHMPIWLRTDHQPPASLPKCAACGGRRLFEFQVLPQLLYYLGIDNSDTAVIDFGTVAVYTCEASCTVTTAFMAADSVAYTEEYVWVQPPT